MPNSIPTKKCPDHENEVISFGLTNYRNLRRRFGIKTPDRRSHMYLIGKTGVGKSTLLENTIYQDIQMGHGLAIVDPHGDLAQKALDFIPSWRVNDVVYFNPADIDFPIAFNILESVDSTHRHFVASGLIAVFKKIWADSWGPRLEYVLRNAILALLEYPGSTLLGIMRILVDKEFRKKVVSRISDPIVRSFWVEEYSKYPDRFQAEAIAPIQNKVGQFLSMNLVRNIVGQVKSKIDIRDIMDNRKILIMNLAKGRIGEDASGLMGAMMITKLQMAAMSRVDMPELEREDFYLYVDEFQNFATESFANILSEARKYRLNLILAHQYITQLDEKVSGAVFGNVGTLISFRVGTEDAAFLSKEFMPQFDETDLVNLDKFEVYIKLMIGGITSEPFSANTLPPLGKAEANHEKIIKVSRERYSEERKVVEDKILRWSGVESSDEDDAAVDKSKYEAKCATCNTKVFVPFIPDGVRPVYCKDCLKEAQRAKATAEKNNPPRRDIHSFPSNSGQR
jgi:CxxC-x17-CxxC domain-containing protein